MAPKKEEKPSFRSRVASKFVHEDEPVGEEPSPKTRGPSEMKVSPDGTRQQSRVGVPIEGEAPAPTYSVGAGAPPEKQKALQATIERDRKELKKKQKPAL